MNVFWIQDGKKLTIIGILFLAVTVVAILRTESTLEAALLGIMLPIVSIITIKAGMGWSRVRYWNKQRKMRKFQ